MLSGDSPPPGLVGIAKLAAKSEVLEAKRTVQYFEIGCKSLLNRTRPGMPFEWSLNPYRGCEFGCRYCYARYTHEFMELRESAQFEDKIYAKSNIEVILRRELNRIFGLYGRMVAAGEWRDYAIDFLKDRAVFSVFRRSAEVPIYRIEKNPKLAKKQGAYSVVSATGLIVRRGHELDRVLRALDKGPSLVAV